MITTYQIKNVLRIYGNQLKKSTLPIKDNADTPKYHAEIVDISVEARSKQMVNRMSGDLISMVTSKEQQQENKEDILDKLFSQDSENERNNHEN